MIRKPAAFALFAALLAATPNAALAWGSTGHRIISRLGVETLPADVPAFLHDPAIVTEIGELGREPDRSRGAGQPHDADLDPGHFFDIDDSGHALGGIAVADLPPTRAEFQVAVSKGGADPAKAGYLPYNIMDGYQQLTKDFTYWRIETIAAQRATDPQQRAYYVADLKLRQDMIVRDLGYWSHFVGDASMPLHVSVHYNTWGDYPNPHHYTAEKIHGPFEGAFVHDHVVEADVRTAMTPPKICADPLQACVTAYLETSRGYVEPLFALWTAGAFQNGDPRAKAFAVERLSAGAVALRDLVTAAWRASADGSIGGRDKAVSVKAVAAGAPVPLDALYGDD